VRLVVGLIAIALCAPLGVIAGEGTADAQVWKLKKGSKAGATAAKAKPAAKAKKTTRTARGKKKRVRMPEKQRVDLVPEEEQEPEEDRVDGMAPERPPPEDEEPIVIQIEEVD
jgi:hypothetical protein